MTDQQKYLIAIAEDNDADMYLIREALATEKLRYDLLSFDDGEEVHAFVASLDHDEKQPCPDVFLIDLNLPKQSGEALLRRLRGSVRCGNTPVIVITASDNPADHARASELRASAYFRKPSDLDEFLKIGPLIRTLVTRPS